LGHHQGSRLHLSATDTFTGILNCFVFSSGVVSCLPVTYGLLQDKKQSTRSKSHGQPAWGVFSMRVSSRPSRCTYRLCCRVAHEAAPSILRAVRLFLEHFSSSSPIITQPSCRPLLLRQGGDKGGGAAMIGAPLYRHPTLLPCARILTPKVLLSTKTARNRSSGVLSISNLLLLTSPQSANISFIVGSLKS
jgi:hypothetical protein